MNARGPLRTSLCSFAMRTSPLQVLAEMLARPHRQPNERSLDAHTCTRFSGKKRSVNPGKGSTSNSSEREECVVARPKFV
jgi:hypothetical protein